MPIEAAKVWIAIVFILIFSMPAISIMSGLLFRIDPNAWYIILPASMINVDISKIFHSLLLPLIGALLIFRKGKLETVSGVFLIATVMVSIIITMASSLLISNEISLDMPMISVYRGTFSNLSSSFSDLVGMLILLLLTIVGIEGRKS